MSVSTGVRRRAVPVWVFVVSVLLAVGGGVLLGRSGLVAARDPEVVTGTATLTNRANWLTIVQAEDLDEPLTFNGRSVDWIDDKGVLWDSFSEKAPPCLRVNESARVDVSYVPLRQGGGVVTLVRCRPAG